MKRHRHTWLKRKERRGGFLKKWRVGSRVNPWPWPLVSSSSREWRRFVKHRMRARGHGWMKCSLKPSINTHSASVTAGPRLLCSSSFVPTPALFSVMTNSNGGRLAQSVHFSRTERQSWLGCQTWWRFSSARVKAMDRGVRWSHPVAFIGFRFTKLFAAG